MRVLFLYIFGVVAIASFMNNQIVHHKVIVKCCHCGGDMLMDQCMISDKGVHAHMACAMEAAGTASGSAFERAKQMRENVK